MAGKRHAPEIALETQARAAAAITEVLRENDLVDDDTLVADMIEGETNLLDAIQAALDEIDDCQITSAGCKAKEAQIAARRKRAEAREQKLRAAIEQALLVADLKSLKLPVKTLTLTAVPPQPVVEDESRVPAEFFVPQPPKLDRVALNAAAKDREIPGVRMTNGGVRLTIRSA